MSIEVVVVGGVRTPFVKAGREFKNTDAVALGQNVLTELMARSNVEFSKVDEVVMGNMGNPSDNPNIARVIALRSGFPIQTSAYTVQRNCASGLESITSGYEKIKSGTLDIVVAGGTESMSQFPFLFTKEFQNLFSDFMFAKTFLNKLKVLKKIKLKYLKPRISLIEGLTDPIEAISMGQTAEILAKEFAISRREQDEFAVKSHHNACMAIQNGRLKKEISPVFLSPEFKKIIEKDIGPRESQSIEALTKLRPYFDRKNGSVTVGNSCPITDGAAAVLLMSLKKAKELRLKPIAKIRSYAYAGLEPKRMGLGPVYATPLALKRAGLKLKDIDSIELNEAFAAQVLACIKAFSSHEFAQKKLGLSQAVGEVDLNKLNVNGGAIALGHPVGVTGTRLVLTLMKELKIKNKQFGLATLCIGGGQGGAIVLENI